MAANYSESMTFPASGAQIFQACTQAVPQCGFTITEANPQAGQIQAKSGMGMLSWGEIITIGVADGRADIRSSCRGMQVIDYGKNKRNVKSLLSALGSMLAPTPQP